MAKVPIYDVKGAKKGEVTLPDAFGTPLRLDVIRKAVNVARSNRRQRYGASPWAGMMHSTKSAGKGKGMSRVPRIGGSGPGALAPPTVGGRRAHPPEARRSWDEKINAKERKLAILAGIAATGNRELVVKRGHKVGEGMALPLVVEDAIESIIKTADVAELLEKMGLGAELARASDGVHTRAGRGKLRGRRHKSPVSILFVTANADKLRKGATNLVGVEVSTPKRLDAEQLAPGGDPGRLTIFSVSALKLLEAF